ncbi:MAG: tRNA uridine-5-carboxymethylaminomethyl(34) synthesis GTPase MnmE [Alphaproteobacteria bacterium]|nr:tRNA uridine-5-carboxymethylaminomethyl(34) synthesis GTPase MnmE [Alphaproteobacteria bacterium]
MTKETIYALSTVFGKSGVAVIRVSGSRALESIKLLTDINVDKIKPRYAYFTNLHSIGGDILDKCLVLYFKSPYSFTGEDVVEFQIHGSRAVISSLMENLGSIEHYRLAEAGEFSKRAFYNNKMDLTEAEGLADLIDAETSEQQKYAIRQMEGNLKTLYSNWREEIVNILSHLEAYIDFPEEDIPHEIIDTMQNTVFKLSEDIKKHLNDNKMGERLREGFRVVIVGPPNAGKSSLLNAIVKRDAVIVSDIAGTTRDSIDIHLDLGGYPVILTDTAGIRETSEQIEKKGIEIALEKVKNADFVICLFDGSIDDVHLFDNIEKNNSNNLIYVANKKDKISSDKIKHFEDNNCMVVSVKDNQDVKKILYQIENQIKNYFTSNSNILITRQRYREALKNALINLNMFSFDKDIELSAEDIRLASRELGKITGRVEVDEILDKIFGSFCIGK